MAKYRGRTYHDPLHGAIALDGRDPTEALLIELIDTPAFQRLRRIRQLGPASLTFHGAESSRFTHSLGVMAIARRAFDRLVHHHPTLRPHRATVLCAALLHDVGHGPFSHTAEEIFASQHETWTERVIRSDPAIATHLNQFAPGLIEAIVAVYHHRHPVPLVWQLVSSQFDCDRLDYLMRDSYFTGAAYGQLDLDRIILAMEYDSVSQQLVVTRKGMAAVEHYLMVRQFMYSQVYNHPKNLAVTWVLIRLFERARQLLADGGLAADPTVRAWLTVPIAQLTLADYLDADDTVLNYHIHRWRSQMDPILADLCRRYEDRELPKALEISGYAPPEQTALLTAVRACLARAGLAPEVYAGVFQTSRSGYKLYHHGIKVNTRAGLQELSTLSAIVRMLAEQQQRSWLIYPVQAAAVVERSGLWTNDVTAKQESGREVQTSSSTTDDRLPRTAAGIPPSDL